MQPFQFELLNILLFPPSSTSKGPFLSHIHNTQMTQVSHNLPLWRYKHLYPEIKRITITVSIFVIFTKIIIIHNMFYQTSSRCCFPLLYICAIFFKAVLFFFKAVLFFGTCWDRSRNSELSKVHLSSVLLRLCYWQSGQA